MVSSLSEKRLESNGYVLSSSPERLGLLSPTDAYQPIEQLREIFQNQGYLWLKHFLEVSEVVSLRHYYLQALRDRGLLPPESNLSDDVYINISNNQNQATIQQETIREHLKEIARLSPFEAFYSSPRLTDFMKTLFGDKSRLHEYKLLRYSVPGEQICTDGHYDRGSIHFFGTDQFCTVWIPINTVSIEMGGITYLEGTDPIGRVMEKRLAQITQASLSVKEQKTQLKRRNGWQNLAEIADYYNKRWLVADYEVGDIIIHTPYIFHAALSNKDEKKRIRLSTDIRFIYA